MSFLDCNGALIPYSYEAWKDENKEGRERISKNAVAQSMYIWSYSSENFVTLPLKVINNLKLRLTDNLRLFIVCLYFILNLVFVTIYNGPTNALVCNETLIQMTHTKRLKITPTCFDHQMIIIRELFDPG
jgi:hypothetical protein